MLKTVFSLATAAAITTLSTAILSTSAVADEWTLNSGQSKIAFGSVKSEEIGEAHHFTNLSGQVGADGTATVAIDVSSLETWIDIRNERMLEHVFNAVSFPVAKIEAQIDMAAVEKLQPGDTAILSTEGVLSIVGSDVEIDAELFVIVISDSKVMVTTDEMIMLATEDLGITAGIDKLMALADLPSITRVTPVTLRLIFDKG
ncbi:MAG: YceI family protein [Pseudomonadota bacterium]